MVRFVFTEETLPVATFNVVSMGQRRLLATYHTKLVLGAPPETGELQEELLLRHVVGRPA